MSKDLEVVGVTGIPEEGLRLKEEDAWHVLGAAWKPVCLELYAEGGEQQAMKKGKHCGRRSIRIWAFYFYKGEAYERGSKM